MQKKVWFVLLGILCLSSYGVAFAENSSFQIGTGIHHMDYKEDLPANRKSTESGWLPSIYASYEYKKPSVIYAKVFTDIAAGNVTYDGTTQGGTPINFNDSKQALFKFETNVGYPIGIGKDFQLIPYTGYGYRFWSRGEARTTSTYSSFKEEYSWSYIPVGLKADYQINKQWNLGGTLAAHFMFGGKMKAYPSEVNSGYSDLDFDLGNKVGFYADLPLTYRFAGNWAATLTAWYEYTAIGQSNAVNVAYNNKVIGYAYEPSSTNNQIGVRFGVSRAF